MIHVWSGRVKIKMEYINNKLRRYTTFSKRKTGIMKKVVFELFFMSLKILYLTDYMLAITRISDVPFVLQMSFTSSG